MGEEVLLDNEILYLNRNLLSVDKYVYVRLGVSVLMCVCVCPFRVSGQLSSADR